MSKFGCHTLSQRYAAFHRCTDSSAAKCFATKTGWWYTYPSEKYEFVNGKDDIPYMKWKIKVMCETTNQKKIPAKEEYFANLRNADRCLSSAVHATAMSWLAETILQVAHRGF